MKIVLLLFPSAVVPGKINFLLASARSTESASIALLFNCRLFRKFKELHYVFLTAYRCTIRARRFVSAPIHLLFLDLDSYCCNWCDLEAISNWE
jgi:hypothetical protein